jgi:hypothetical protein
VANIWWSLGSFTSGSAAGADGLANKGPQAYVTYHNAIYATGHNEGKLTAEYIPRGSVKSRAGHLSSWRPYRIRGNSVTLQSELGLTGTPGIIVMPVSGATPDTITVFPEAVTAERLQAAIRKATRVKFY